MPDSSIQAAHERAIQRVGQPVTFGRPSGVAPNIVLLPTGGASVTAIVREYVPDSQTQSQEGYGSGSVGGLTQGERQIIVMAQDLALAGFPLNAAGFPALQKGDKVTITQTGEEIQITRVDSGKRYIAAAIEAFGVGVA